MAVIEAIGAHNSMSIAEATGSGVGLLVVLTSSMTIGTANSRLIGEISSSWIGLLAGLITSVTREATGEGRSVSTGELIDVEAGGLTDLCWLDIMATSLGDVLVLAARDLRGAREFLVVVGLFAVADWGLRGARGCLVVIGLFVVRGLRGVRGFLVVVGLFAVRGLRGA
jgi:hypothetical protein